MKFHRICACIDGQTCRVADLFHQVMNIFFGEWLTDQILVPESPYRTGRVRRGKWVGKLLTAQTRRKLYTHLGTVVVAAFNQHVQTLHMMKIGQLGAGTGFIFCGNYVGTGDDQTGTTFGTLHKIVNSFFAVRAICFTGGSHGTHENTVFQFHRTQLGFVK